MAAYLLTISRWKLQASIAKGDPEDAINTFKKTLSSVIIAENQLSSALDSPEEAFTLQAVEELTQSQGTGVTGQQMLGILETYSDLQQLERVSESQRTPASDNLNIQAHVNHGRASIAESGVISFDSL